MTAQSITQSQPQVKHTFIKAKDGAILVGASPLEVLTWMSRTHPGRIKGFDTNQGQVVKFMGGRVEEIRLTAADYDLFVSHLKETGWQLRPAVTSGGFTAVRVN